MVFKQYFQWNLILILWLVVCCCVFSELFNRHFLETFLIFWCIGARSRYHRSVSRAPRSIVKYCRSMWCFKKKYYIDPKSGKIKKRNFKKCKRCEEATYCSRQCQKRDWKWHKQYCSKNGSVVLRARMPHVYETTKIRYN